ncbi:uncharacterized protein LACBIDRAFT_292838 [Laccaria bicolor S238N-H82]|uniref:Predicted protein n=1 Tax=Laccaria bicolor (strain S238N-H82 / ATCC MYA-4686) TaxID=486041 RepID=B0CY07_LACBS|nr:uncharacterized protein LACBIDRAFT_292838 [Laccaria bicolor S238N-H82]EDR12358.1 predicted protein [Laccaria bicolor S238N-H82]|eukprot:XP_001876622.1 predicted protein [Laccaria bicolor S238N-H82]
MPPINIRIPPNRAATTPVSDPSLLRPSQDYSSSYPQVLDSNYGPQTIHRSDLFFINQGTHMSRSQPGADFSPAQLYPYHQQHYALPQPRPPPLLPPNSHPQPTNFHRSVTEPLPPPIPPKPFHPQSIPEFNLTNPAEVDKPPLVVQSSNGRPSSPTDEDELAVALALSQSESIQRKLREEALATQEEEELARALAESMLSTGGNLTDDHNPFFSEAASSMSRIYENQSPPQTQVHSNYFESSTVSPSFVSHVESFSFSNGGSTELGRYENWGTPGMSRRSSIETEVEPGKRLPQNPSPTPGGIDILPDYHKGGHEISSFPEKSPPNDRGSTSQHRQTEEYLTTDGEFRHSSNVVMPNPYSASGGQNEIYSYNASGESINISDDEAFARRLAAEEEAAAQSISLHPVALGSLAPAVTGTNIEPESPTELPYYYADNTSSRSYSDTTTVDATPHPLVVEPSLTVTPRTYPSLPAHTSPASNLPAEDSQSIPSFVSSDFSGVQPLLYNRLHPSNTIHSVTSNDRCITEHCFLALRALPSSAFSGSELATPPQATGQFVKPHQAAQDWRTILWFSIDQLVPPNTPGAAKYSAFNPNMLPWSYTLAPIPTLLHDAVDTPRSKTYTIPATDIIPYPTLPITFPNLAMYLQAALDDSRRHTHESTGGKKLGKMVQLCYPNSDDGPTESSERGSVSGLFKRVIGRGNKTNKKNRANNEDTYELVTPFVPDEWG